MGRPFQSSITFSVLALALAGCGAGSASSPTATATTTVTVTPDQPPSAPAGTYPAGIYLVPADISPGTYRTAGPSGDSIVGCRFARLRDASGSSSAVVAYQSSMGPSVVTIQPTDGAFKTDDCQPWTKVK